MRVIGSVFAGRDQAGDFAWMIAQPGYAAALFVFNDNEEEFRGHQRHARSGACRPGGGNAVIRPYQCQLPPRAAGVPTGVEGHGYQQLDEHTREVIDDALREIAELVATGQFDELYFSASPSDPGDLGTGIFSVAPAVRRYIVNGLRALSTER
jgi:hypothetical protein